MANLQTLLLLLALISLFSLSFAIADFEGFEAEEFEYEEETNESINSPASTSFSQSPAAETSQSAAEISSPNGEKPNPSSTLELWDEEEFEGIPSQTPDPRPDSPAPAADPAAPAAAESGPSVPPSYAVEILCVSFLVAFAVNFFVGRRQNELIALCWASQFATKDSVFDRNFSLLGTGDGKEDAPLLLKEGVDVFKFYASGRRFCQGLLATMELRSRHDLIARLTDLLFGKKDVIAFEVVMNEDAMDHVVLAVARRKLARVVHKESRDLQRFGAMMTAGPAGRRWVAEDLAVVAESKEVAGDLVTDVVIDQVREFFFFFLVDVIYCCGVFYCFDLLDLGT